MTASHASSDMTIWQRLDAAAFGIIYGAIMVLSLLMAVGDHPESPVKTAVVLFGSVFAITLVKAFSEFIGHALESKSQLERAGWRAAWAHSYPTLTVANVPAALFLMAGLEWISPEMAGFLAQALCIGLLMLLGARVGWATKRKAVPAVLGALFAGGIGLALAALKLAIH